MDTQDTTTLLAQLRGNHLPSAPTEPSLWPVAVAVLVVVLAALVLLYKKQQNTSSWARDAINELNRIEQKSPRDSLYLTASLLKRIAITNDNTNKVKHLAGDQWLNYLNSFFHTQYFTAGNGKIFGTALYQLNTEPPEAINKEIKKLIRRKRWTT